ncbi:MAG TPA: dTDP-4-dehydrorhamnose reductase [Polyangiaceae bacterium]|nr:dTDP-4-dehydrorhamnose reductase [Polyangiaceae bacterium]
MRIALVGSGGQLGQALAGTLACVGRVTAFDRAALDLRDMGAVRAAVRAAKPEVVVNAAAYTDVDRAEADEATAMLVNGDAVGALGEECRRISAGLVHYSTDFVFDGRRTDRAPYREDEPTGPLGAYGRSKLAGEQALAALGAPAIVFRTAWVYSPKRRSFVSSILRLARERDELRVVADQVGNPTLAADLATATALVLHAMRRDPFGAIDEARGIYHLAGAGAATRFELARAVIELDPRRAEHRAKRVEPIATADYPLPAPRPAFAPLDCRKALERFGVELPPWRYALARALRD